MSSAPGIGTGQWFAVAGMVGVLFYLFLIAVGRRARRRDRDAAVLAELPTGRRATRRWRPGQREWYDMPIPPRWHRCRTASAGVLDGRLYERCACGATQLDGGHWMERNARRRAER